MKGFRSRCIILAIGADDLRVCAHRNSCDGKRQYPDIVFTRLAILPSAVEMNQAVKIKLLSLEVG